MVSKLDEILGSTSDPLMTSTYSEESKAQVKKNQVKALFNELVDSAKTLTYVQENELHRLIGEL